MGVLLHLVLFVLLVSNVSTAPVDFLHHDIETDDGDIQSILSYFKGGSDIESLTEFLHKFQTARKTLTPLINMSPLFREILTETSGKNIQLKILLKVIEGHFPDIKDIYDLVTSKNNPSISKTISIVERKNKKYNRLVQLIDDPDLLKSNVKIEELIKLLTGLNITVDQKVLDLITAGRYPTSTMNVSRAELNVLEIVFFLVKNYWLISNNFYTLVVPRFSHIDTLNHLLSMDTSHLSWVFALPNTTRIHGKYTVARPKERKIDPDAAAILHDIETGKNLDKTDPKSDKKAENIMLDMVLHMLNMVEKSLRALTTDSQSTGAGGSGSTVLG